MPITLELIMLPSAAGGVPTLAPRWVIWGISASATTTPTAVTLAIALAPSNGIREPNVFLAPAIGLSLPHFGLIAWNDGFMPTWPTLTTTAAAAQIPAIGATVVSVVCRASWSSSCSPAALVAAPGWEISANTVRIAVETPSMTFGPMNIRETSPAARTTAPFRSVLLATLPCLRASLRRLGVAFSVLLGSAMGSEGVQGGRDRGVHLVGDPSAE